MTNISRRIWMAGALAVTLGGLLAGCDPAGDGEQSVLEEAVETGEAVQTDNSVDVATGELPEGWPDEIPVVEGEIVGSSAWETNGDTTWTVQIAVVNETDGFQAAVSELEARGFTVRLEGESGTGHTATLEDERYTVDLVADDNGGNPTLNYIVAAR